MKILIVRGFGEKISIDNYNSQEVGLAKSLYDKGHSCDIVYYTDDKEFKTEIIKIGNYNIKIFWTPGINVMKNAVFTSILNKEFLNQYDIIQTHEYSQLMTYILAKVVPEKLVLYHGPYKGHKYKIVEYIYDKLFTKYIVENLKTTIVKSNLAANYLGKKGFTNIHNVGVGLDISKFYEEKSKTYENKTLKKIDKDFTDVIIYIGKLDERRNIKFILEVMKEIVIKNKKDTKLIIVGSGKKSDVSQYMEYAKFLNIYDNIVHIENLNQSQLKNIYKMADVFIFPSNYDIFGMVLLESMYFGVPVISSLNGGASTIIEHNKNGIIIDTFNSKLWSKEVLNLLNNSDKKNEMSKRAKMSVEENYTWDKLADRFIDAYEETLEKNKIK